MAHELTDVALAPVSQALADNIASLRKARGLSQHALAKLASLPRSTLTYLESGSGNPSLQNLIRIAGALQVSIEELLQRPRPACQIIRRADVPVQKRAHGAVLVHKILPDPIPGMEIDQMELAPSARMGGTPHTQNTKEYLVCTAGRMEITVAGEKYAVETGDVLAFPGDQPHSYFNPGRVKAECLSVVVLAPQGI